MRTLLLTLLLVPVLAVTAQVPDTILSLRAPDLFRARFHTTAGDFTVEVHRDWSPLGADRLYQLLKTNFYDSNCLFRVQKEYVVQFGIGNNKEVNGYWDKLPIRDEPVRTSNARGTVSYARDGADSRTAQLFINLKDNPKLDTVDYNGVKGFPPVGVIVEGFDAVERFNGAYGFGPANDQDSAMVQGNAYWNRKYPGLDYILRARTE